jgi:putative PIN family toxin of toxin-antitoxin system
VRIVLDTNVAVSALLWRGTPYSLLEAVRRSERTQLFTSPFLLTELAEVIVRPWSARRLAVIGRAAHDVLAEYIRAVELVTPSAVPSVVARDADDDHVVAAAVAADAALIATGDRDLLSVGRYDRVRIVTPAEAIRLVAAG